MSKKGFTLIELLVVIIILGVLTSIAMPQYRKAMDRAKAAEAMEMLPALFESRERWRIFNGYTWDEGSLKKEDGTSVSPSVRALDIEGAGMDSNFKTKNFAYTIISGVGNGSDQACVSAKPQWGASRGLTGATIYYRGDKFSCTDGGTAGVCDILNVAESDHRSGCI